MQFSPKKTEKYLSAIRNYLHKRICTCGINTKRLYIAKKLYICSTLYKPDPPTPTDIALFCKVILSCAQVELYGCGKRFEFDIKGDTTLLVPRDLFAALILETVIYARKLQVNIIDNRVYIIYNGKAPQKRLKAIIRASGGTYLFERKKRTHAIFMRFSKTHRVSQKITGAVELLTDPLSVVKVFILPSG